jgi:hypothetical protein
MTSGLQEDERLAGAGAEAETEAERSRGLPADRLRLVLITGLSGSGKSVVAKCFEDLGYYTVDNLPLPLLREFLERPGELVFGHERIAVVADLRAPGFAEEFPRLIAEIDRTTQQQQQGPPGDASQAGRVSRPGQPGQPSEASQAGAPGPPGVASQAG